MDIKIYKRGLKKGDIITVNTCDLTLSIISKERESIKWDEDDKKHFPIKEEKLIFQIIIILAATHNLVPHPINRSKKYLFSYKLK